MGTRKTKTAAHAAQPPATGSVGPDKLTTGTMEHMTIKEVLENNETTNNATCRAAVLKFHAPKDAQPAVAEPTSRPQYTSEEANAAAILSGLPKRATEIGSSPARQEARLQTLEEETRRLMIPILESCDGDGIRGCWEHSTKFMHSAVAPSKILKVKAEKSRYPARGVWQVTEYKISEDVERQYLLNYVAEFMYLYWTVRHACVQNNVSDTVQEKILRQCADLSLMSSTDTEGLLADNRQNNHTAGFFDMKTMQLLGEQQKTTEFLLEEARSHNNTPLPMVPVAATQPPPQPPPHAGTSSKGPVQLTSRKPKKVTKLLSNGTGTDQDQGNLVRFQQRVLESIGAFDKYKGDDKALMALANMLWIEIDKKFTDEYRNTYVAGFRDDKQNYYAHGKKDVCRFIIELGYDLDSHNLDREIQAAILMFETSQPTTITRTDKRKWKDKKQLLKELLLSGNEKDGARVGGPQQDNAVKSIGQRDGVPAPYDVEEAEIQRPTQKKQKVESSPAVVIHVNAGHCSQISQGAVEDLESLKKKYDVEYIRQLFQRVGYTGYHPYAFNVQLFRGNGKLSDKVRTEFVCSVMDELKECADTGNLVSFAELVEIVLQGIFFGATS